MLTNWVFTPIQCQAQHVEGGKHPVPCVLIKGHSGAHAATTYVMWPNECPNESDRCNDIHAHGMYTLCCGRPKGHAGLHKAFETEWPPEPSLGQPPIKGDYCVDVSVKDGTVSRCTKPKNHAGIHACGESSWWHEEARQPFCCKESLANTVTTFPNDGVEHPTRFCPWCGRTIQSLRRIAILCAIADQSKNITDDFDSKFIEAGFDAGEKFAKSQSSE